MLATGASMNDSQAWDLVQRCIRGEEEAWREFHRRYTPYLRGAAFRTLRWAYGRVAEADLDEVAAETYAELVRNRMDFLRKYDGRTSLKHWLALLAHRTALRYLRKRERTRRLEMEVGSSTPDPIAAESSPGAPLCTPESLSAALETLSPQEREWLERLFVREESSRCVARACGIPPSTFAERIEKLLKKLADCLRNTGWMLFL